jgi:hypothetical protein
VNCTAVRDRLPERALGAVSQNDGQVLDRHLAWCAACRKEAGEMERAAATFAFALAPVEPETERQLEDRVVDVVRSAASKRQPLVTRRSRLAVALAVAGMVAVSGLGWGAVMAGRAARFEHLSQQVKFEKADAAQRFQDVLSGLEFSDPSNEVSVANLTTGTRGATASGSAVTLVSSTTPDVAIVMVNGFRQADAQGLPFRVFLRSERGRMLRVGVIRSLDTGGGAIAFRRFDLDLSGFNGIEVRSVDGSIVLQGSVTLQSAISTPSP